MTVVTDEPITVGDLSPKVIEGMVNAGHEDFTGPYDVDTRSGRASAIQDAIDFAENKSPELPFVLVPDSLGPGVSGYDASSVNFSGSGGTWAGRMVREGNLSDVYDVKAYGAAGDGSTDDTAAIQAAIDAAIDIGDSGRSGTVYLPDGSYRITSTVSAGPYEAFEVNGTGASVFVWDGDSSSPMFSLDDPGRGRMSGFRVEVASGSTLQEAFLLQTVTDTTDDGTNQRPYRQEFNRLYVTDGAGTLTRGFTVKQGAGGDANNDFHRWIKVRCSNYQDVGCRIEDIQTNWHVFRDCHFTDGVAAVETTSQGSFVWYGGFVGSHTTADFDVADSGQPIILEGLDSEQSNRLIQVGGTSTPIPVSIRNVRWSGGSIDADNIGIKHDSAGTLEVVGCELGNTATDFLISINFVGDSGGKAVIHSNYFAHDNAAASSPLSVKASEHNEIYLFANAYNEGDSGTTPFGVFTDGDSTPLIYAGRVFKTANSAATTLTDFDGGFHGKEIKVIFGDGNTTVDFTGTSLKGNGGVDWSPAQNDHMTCVYDGTNWYCDISDNTA